MVAWGFCRAQSPEADRALSQASNCRFLIGSIPTRRSQFRCEPVRSCLCRYTATCLPNLSNEVDGAVDLISAHRSAHRQKGVPRIRRRGAARLRAHGEWVIAGRERRPEIQPLGGRRPLVRAGLRDQPALSRRRARPGLRHRSKRSRRVRQTHFASTSAARIEIRLGMCVYVRSCL